MRKIAIWLCSAILVLVLGFLGFRQWVIAHLDFSSLGQPSNGAADVMRAIVAVASGVKEGRIAWRKADYSSVGFPQKERELLDLRRALDLFEIAYGHLPAKSGDLMSLANPQQDTNATERRTCARLATECQLVPLGKDSFLLNCDGWPLPNEAAVHSLVGTFDQQTEKFYLVQGHVLLYLPPFEKKPLTTR